MAKIQDVLEKNQNRIFNSLYPASVASDILVNEHNFDYESSKKVFTKWLKEKGAIANIDNF